jgi:hypothetical protein
LRNFVRRYLSPADRLAEVLCGLIMVLSFTLVAAPQVGEGPEGVRTLLLATIGCNLAWGIIDGALFVLAAMTQRGQRLKTFQAVKAARDETAAVEIIRHELGARIPEDAPAEIRNHLYRAMVPVIAKIKEPPRLMTGDDLLGGLSILLLEVLCTLPAAVPFLLMNDHWLALRTSNLLLVLLLFAVGYKWGGTAIGKPWTTGLAMLSIGASLVAVALALGG